MRRSRPPHRRTRPGAPGTATPDGLPLPRPAADEGRSVCGWFDSSHDLSLGLRVTEHAQPEAVAQLVPLRWWLAWELDAAATAAPPPIRQGRGSSA